MCNTVECLSECATNKPTIHHITDELWVAEHNKGALTHFCIFNDKTDNSVLSLVIEGEECPCLDKILTHPHVEMKLAGPIIFMGHLRDICDEMKLVRDIDINIVNHNMACKRCVQLKVTEGEH